MADLIGRGKCPLCASTKARFSITKKDLACMTCDSCNCQIFTRSDSSDEKLRAFIAPKEAPAAPVPAPAPAAKVDAPAPAPAPAAEKKPRGFFESLGI